MRKPFMHMIFIYLFMALAMPAAGHDMLSRSNQLVHQLNHDQYAIGRDKYKLEAASLGPTNPLYVFYDGVSSITNCKDDLIANMFMPLDMVEEVLKSLGMTLYTAKGGLLPVDDMLTFLETLLGATSIEHKVLAFNIIFGLPASYDAKLIPWLEGKVSTLPSIFCQLLGYRYVLTNREKARFFLAVGYVRCMQDAAKFNAPALHGRDNYDDSIELSQNHFVSPFILEMIRRVFKVSPITDTTLDEPKINAFLQYIHVFDKKLIHAVGAYIQTHSPSGDPFWIRCHGLRHLNILLGKVQQEATPASPFEWSQINKGVLDSLHTNAP